MENNQANTLLEYIWVGGKGEIRSKTKVVSGVVSFDIACVPEWNYDGSSTWQADSNGDTEIILKPCFILKDPIRKLNNVNSYNYLVLCDTYDSSNNPTPTNHRYMANNIFKKGGEYKPWFGLEQEYFMEMAGKTKNETDGFHYCGKAINKIERIIVEEHMNACIESGLQISGINSEVENYQWEFQIGPCEGILAADQLVIARYLLERISEKYETTINYHPKPNKDINGSGCHINFSTYITRCHDGGIEEIHRCINCLSKNPNDIMKLYGNNNELRLTGIHETSKYDKFTWGVGTRNTSIRIPNQVIRDKCGYFEDRRPASNIDPYLSTSNLFKTCYLDTANDVF